jgi:hypothetical protein
MLLVGRPKFGFKFTATETLEGHWLTRQQAAQQPKASHELTMGELWTQVSTLTDMTTGTSHSTSSLSHGTLEETSLSGIFAVGRYPTEPHHTFLCSMM